MLVQIVLNATLPWKIRQQALDRDAEKVMDEYAAICKKLEG